MIEAIDYFGNQILVGDLVVYPNRQGSSMWMNRGTVTAVGTKVRATSTVDIYPVIQIRKVQTYYDGRFAGLRNVEVECLNRVIVLGRGYGVRGNWEPRKVRTTTLGPIENLDINPLHTTWLDRLMAWLRG